MLNLLYGAFHDHYTKEMPGTKYQANPSCYKLSLVSPGTHLVKTHESQSRNSESPFKKKNDSEIENAGPLVNQAVDLKTDSKTLYYCIL